jgi:hypothetical protein
MVVVTELKWKFCSHQPDTTLIFHVHIQRRTEGDTRCFETRIDHDLLMVSR